jgi:putative glutamine amidotransferase
VRPLIGITQPDRGDRATLWVTRLALAQAGARSIVLTAKHPGEDLVLDGLMLGGGPDVHPHLFSAAPKADYSYDHGREGMELAWLRQAWSIDLPTLGVCRGAQLMNVAAGGALHQILSDAFPGTRYPKGWFEQIVFRKRIIIAPRSRLASIVGEGDLCVNSFHSQAVSEIGQGLCVGAQEANGAIQAIEAPTRRFWLGVQFHPEFLIYHRRFRWIFDALVRAARDAAANRASPEESVLLHASRHADGIDDKVDAR